MLTFTNRTTTATYSIPAFSGVVNLIVIAAIVLQQRSVIEVVGFTTSTILSATLSATTNRRSRRSNNCQQQFYRDRDHHQWLSSSSSSSSSSVQETFRLESSSNNNNSSNDEQNSFTRQHKRRHFLMQSSTSMTLFIAAATTTSPTMAAAAAADTALSEATTQQQQSTAAAAAALPKNNRRIGGLASKIRQVSTIMDELQRDLMQERWDLVGAYPTQLRSFVTVFTTYTDAAFPTDAPTDKGLRVALRYEVGRFFAALERFKQSSQRQALDEAYIAYSEMSLHLDRYMRVGGLYTYYDDTITTETYYKSADDLIYAPPKKDPALVRDLIVLIAGPDMGKTGIVIGIYQDGSKRSVVKLDRYKTIREIRVVPTSWVAKRVGEQNPDDVFLLPNTAATASTAAPAL